MKKNTFISVFLCFSLLFCFCSCNANKNNKISWEDYASFDFVNSVELVDGYFLPVTFVNSAAQLIGAVNSSSAENYIMLTSNIKFANLPSNFPADLSSSKTFDGNGFTIYGVNITSRTTKNVGFFNSNAGTVKNCVFENLIVSSSSSSVENLGGIVGYNTGTISNCYIKSGNIISNANIAKVGGAVGYNKGGVLKGITNNATTSSGYSAYIGGIAGESSGMITGCANYGNVTRSMQYNTISYCGGIVGKTSSAVKSSINKGTILCNSYYSKCYVGGIAGYSSLNIESSANTANVTGTTYDSSGSYAGGIAGYSSSSIKYCTSGGKISMNVGTTTSSSGITNPYAFSYQLADKIPSYDFEYDEFVNSKRNTLYSYYSGKTRLTGDPTYNKKTYKQSKGYTGGIAGYGTTISSVYFSGSIGTQNTGVITQWWGYKLFSYYISKKVLFVGKNDFKVIDREGLYKFKFSISLVAKLYYGGISGNNINASNSYYTANSADYTKSKFLNITGTSIGDTYDTTAGIGSKSVTKDLYATTAVKTYNNYSVTAPSIYSYEDLYKTNYLYDNPNMLGTKICYFSGQTYQQGNQICIIQQYFLLASDYIEIFSVGTSYFYVIKIINYFSYLSTGYTSVTENDGITDEITISGFDEYNQSLTSQGTYNNSVSAAILGNTFWSTNSSIFGGKPYPKGLYW